MSILNRAEMFNRKASSYESKSSEIIENLEIKKGSVVADVGSGGGFFTLHFAAETGLNGKVYAIDINEKFLEYIDEQASISKLTNIDTILIDDKVKDLPENGCDLIFFRNVYHHINDTEKYFKNIRQFLKPDGKIVIIDYKDNGGFSFISLFKHHIDEEDIISCLKNSGYEHTKQYNFLPKQSFNIFKVK